MRGSEIIEMFKESGKWKVLIEDKRKVTLHNPTTNDLVAIRPYLDYSEREVSDLLKRLKPQ